MDGTKKWLRKSLVVLITILTFGLVTPSDFSWFAEAHPLKDTNNRTQENSEISYSPIVHTDEFDREQYVAMNLKIKRKKMPIKNLVRRFSLKLTTNLRQ